MTRDAGREQLGDGDIFGQLGCELLSDTAASAGFWWLVRVPLVAFYLRVGREWR
jgi:hypothetical protein